MPKSSERVRAKALAYYYEHREHILKGSMEERRKSGVPARVPAMSMEIRLARVIMCTMCGQQVTTPSLLKKCQHVCNRCRKAARRRLEKEQGIAGAATRRYRVSPNGAMIKFKRWKASQKCTRCGYSGDPQQLHFHHRDPSIKKFKIARMVYRYGAKALWEEIAKCDLLCERCHKQEHNYVLPRSR